MDRLIKLVSSLLLIEKKENVIKSNIYGAFAKPDFSIFDFKVFWENSAELI